MKVASGGSLPENKKRLRYVLLVPQISGTRSFRVPSETVGNTFLFRAFFRVGMYVIFAFPFLYLRHENITCLNNLKSVFCFKNFSFNDKTEDLSFSLDC